MPSAFSCLSLGVEEDLIRRSWPEGVRVVSDVEDAAEAEWLVADSSDPRIDISLLESLARLRVIQILNHGANFMARPEIAEVLRQRKILVARAPTGGEAMAEFTLMALVALARGILPAHRALAENGDWSAWKQPPRRHDPFGGELAGARIGIASLGVIGEAIARKAHAFGMEVWGITRNGRNGGKSGAPVAWCGTLDALDEMLEACPCLVLCLPLCDETRGLITGERLARLPSGALVVNISRGGIVDEGALFACLESGHIAGTALDVWERENELGRSDGAPSPLPFHRHNVIMTPHYASLTRNTRRRAVAFAGENMRRWMRGEPLRALDVLPP